VRAGDRERVELLLCAGASADSADSHGVPALHAAAMHNRRALVELLLEAGADVERASVDRWGARPLHAALHSQLAAGELKDRLMCTKIKKLKKSLKKKKSKWPSRAFPLCAHVAYILQMSP